MATVRIILNNPNVVRVGDYIPGEVYEVEEQEAQRLIKVKGFELAEKPAKPADKPVPTA